MSEVLKVFYDNLIKQGFTKQEVLRPSCFVQK